MANVRIAGGKKKMKKIEFIASLPPIQSAINIDGQGKGARIKLDFPATELNKVIELQGYIGQNFKVTIEGVDEL